MTVITNVLTKKLQFLDAGINKIYKNKPRAKCNQVMSEKQTYTLVTFFNIFYIAKFILRYNSVKINFQLLLL